MCLINIAYQQHSRYPLLLAANRDEFYARPTRPAAFWPGQSDLLAGKDLQAGGTWMGVDRHGRLAAVTNYRDPKDTGSAPRSRGELPLGFLGSKVPAAEFLAELSGRAQQYAGFNLLLADASGLHYYSNAGDLHQRGPRRLSPGLYGLSNASLNTPWPKVERARRCLQDCLTTHRLDHDALASTVLDMQLADPEELRGLGLEGSMAQALSAQQIRVPGYGTRATTTLLLGHRTMDWRELNWREDGSLALQRQWRFHRH